MQKRDSCSKKGTEQGDLRGKLSCKKSEKTRIGQFLKAENFSRIFKVLNGFFHFSACNEQKRTTNNAVTGPPTCRVTIGPTKSQKKNAA